MITLAFFFKNEEEALPDMLQGLRPFVNEIIGVDDFSTDRSVEIVEDYGGRVYTARLANFGAMRTLTAHLATEPVVLMVDPDERLLYPERIQPLAEQCSSGEIEALALPRRRWADLEMTMELEPEAFPDWQVRLFRNDTRFRFRRPVHEYFDGGAVEHLNYNHLPEIAHFDQVFHADTTKGKNRMYLRMIAQEGVAAFVAESLQQEIQMCDCIDEEQPCDTCHGKRKLINTVMHRVLSWEDIQELSSDVHLALDLQALREEFDKLVL